jgi:hypothetical protein
MAATNDRGAAPSPATPRPRARLGGGPSRRGTCRGATTRLYRLRGSDYGRVETGIEAVAASHASMVSQPEALTRLILSAVEETSRTARDGLTVRSLSKPHPLVPPEAAVCRLQRRVDTKYPENARPRHDEIMSESAAVGTSNTVSMLMLDHAGGAGLWPPSAP